MLIFYFVLSVQICAICSDEIEVLKEEKELLVEGNDEGNGFLGAAMGMWGS